MENLRNRESELKSLVETILAEAKQQGADQAEVSVSSDAGLAVSVRKGELENLEFNQDQGFGITVYLGKRKGSSSTTDSSQQAIQETVAAAKRIATYTQEDECSGLADASLAPTQLDDLDLYHPWDVEPEELVTRAQACEAAGLAVDKRLTNSDGAQVNTQQAMRIYGNSHGFIGAYSSTRHGMSCVLIGEDDSGMQRDYWYTTSRDHNGLEATDDVGQQAGERTIARLSPRKAPTGQFPVIYSAQVASGLFGHLIGAISGGSQYRKASFLLDAIGEKVLPDWLSLVERPHLKRALGSANFDSDGVATKEKAFVQDGVVASYILSVYSSRKLGLEPTGNAGGVYNLDIEAPATPYMEMIGSIDRGLLVTELMGQGINGVTGDYSRGAAGFWIENGTVQYPVAEVTVAGNLKDMYRTIEAVGDDVDFRGNIRAPSVQIESMMIAGE
ncbi:MAG: metalloprotease PmbA [Pseudomonadales bacterium]|nr:metalloprotease PmbA [Pseudomonadales bacterium]